MELALILLIGVGVLVWLGTRSRTEAVAEYRRELTLEIFEDRSRGFALHFPSMTAVHTHFAPVVLWSEVKRTDGPTWSLRQHDEAKKSDWTTIDDGRASQIETAYQRFLQSSFATAGHDRRWFFEQVKRWIEITHGGCEIAGDAPPQAAQTAAPTSPPPPPTKTGKKICPYCQELIAASALRCACGYVFK